MYDQEDMTVCTKCGARAVITTQTKTHLKTRCMLRDHGCGKSTLRLIERKMREPKPPSKRQYIPTGKPRGRPKTGTAPTLAERVAKCRPPIPHAIPGKSTWYCVSTVVSGGAVYKCLEYGRLRDLQAKHPTDQVLKISEYPAATFREFIAMIEAAETQTTEVK
jgi:hypothetical protein